MDYLHLTIVEGVTRCPNCLSAGGGGDMDHWFRASSFQGRGGEEGGGSTILLGQPCTLCTGIGRVTFHPWEYNPADLDYMIPKGIT
jgi:hypothetical protein